MAVSRGKFFSGRKATVEAVDLHMETGHLVITAAEGRVLGRWPVDRIFRDETHFVSFVIGCGGDDERIELLDENIVPELNVKKSVWTLGHIKRSKNQIWLWALGSIAGIGLLLWYSGAVTRFAVNRVSLEQERKLGELIVSRSEWKPCTLNEEQQAAADEILERLYKADPEAQAKIRLYWVDDPMKNAFTLPGGAIYFFTGLMNYVDSPEEFAGILAHEIEHVERRHIMESVMKGLMLTAGFNFIFGDFSAIVLIDPSTAAQILSLRLSRAMESEADRGALKRLQAAGISPRGMVDFFARLSEKDLVGSKLSFLSTHPFTEDRARFFERAIPKDDNPFESFLATEKWDALKSVCGKVQTDDGETI